MILAVLFQFHTILAMATRTITPFMLRYAVDNIFWDTFAEDMSDSASDIFSPLDLNVFESATNCGSITKRTANALRAHQDTIEMTELLSAPLPMEQTDMTRTCSTHYLIENNERTEITHQYLLVDAQDTLLETYTRETDVGSQLSSKMFQSQTLTPADRQLILQTHTQRQFHSAVVAYLWIQTEENQRQSFMQFMLDNKVCHELLFYVFR